MLVNFMASDLKAPQEEIKRIQFEQLQAPTTNTTVISFKVKQHCSAESSRPFAFICLMRFLSGGRRFLMWSACLF